MATTLALPFNSRTKEWHKPENSESFCSTVPEPTTSLRHTMAHPPMDSESMGSQVAQKPRLPSFSNFLSGTGRPDLNFVPHGPGSNRHDSTQQQLSQTNHNRPLGHHVPQQVAYSPPDPNVLQHLDQVSRRLSVQQSPVQPTFWQNSSPNSLERHAPLPPHLSQLSPPEHGYGRMVVGERTVPGKGICYIYDDGTMCQKIINGDTVNPKWGTTKAGKPRKRLGQACNTCREKKIKCDPSVPKCAQCQKFGRECKFESTARSNPKQSTNGQSATPSSPSEMALERHTPRRESTASTEPSPSDHVSLQQGVKSSMPVHSLLSPTSMDDLVQDDVTDPSPPTKKARFSASPRPASSRHPSDAVGNEVLPKLISSPASIANFSWKTDPYELDRELTLYLLSRYFSHIGCATDCTIPRKPFTHWVTTSSNKSSADLMLIYAMLSMGALFSRRRDLQLHYQVFTDVVQEAVMKNGDSFSLQLIHTRLILSLIAFSQGQYNRSLEYTGSARITSCGLNYNMEEGVSAITSPDELVFGFDRAMTIECRRRTFWTAYIMECFNGCCSASVRAVYRSDCHLRLPCEQSAFEKGSIPLVAFELALGVDGNKPTVKSSAVDNVGLLGYMVEMATIFNEVVSRISRSRTQSSEGYSTSSNAFCRDVMGRLEIWDQYLDKAVNRPGTDKDKYEPMSGPRILYHYTAMLLYRHVYHAKMDSQSIATHVRETYRHAQAILENVQRVSNEEKRDAPMAKLAATSPVSGFAIVEALDTITAAGTLYDLMDGGGQVMSSISMGLEALERLTDYWQSARLQRDITKERLNVLLNATKRASDFNGAFYFGQPMQSPFGPEQDVVYGLSRMRYFQALGWADKIHSDGDFHRL